MTVEDFRKTLDQDQPSAEVSTLLKALWYAGKDEWDRAHDIAQDVDTSEGAWVHAYLHRVEGDLWNADYWYRRAGKNRPATTPDEEWGALVTYFLKL